MRIAIVVVLAGVLVAGAWTWGASSSRHVPAQTRTDRRIEALAHQVARGMGNHPLRAVEYVAARRKPANAVASGDIVDSNPPVYVIAVRGSFVDYEASVPSGAALPRGSVLTLVVTRSGFRITDLGVGHRWPHLARLGQVHVLQP